MRFCWHLRAGFARETETHRIAGYAGYFYRNYLSHRFSTQGRILSNCRNLLSPATAKRMSSFHRRLTRLFEDKAPDDRALRQMEDRLEEFMLFEQRVFLTELEDNLCPVHVQLLTGEESTAILESWHDRFWELR